MSLVKHAAPAHSFMLQARSQSRIDPIVSARQRWTRNVRRPTQVLRKGDECSGVTDTTAVFYSESWWIIECFYHNSDNMWHDTLLYSAKRTNLWSQSQEIVSRCSALLFYHQIFTVRNIAIDYLMKNFIKETTNQSWSPIYSLLLHLMMFKQGLELIWVSWEFQKQYKRKRKMSFSIKLDVSLLVKQFSQTLMTLHTPVTLISLITVHSCVSV